MFAVALAAVVLVSSVVLLYQYWSGALLLDDRDAGFDAHAAPDVLPTAPAFHVDTAA